MGPTEGWVGRFFSRENAVFTGYAAVFGWLALLACSGGCLCSPERVLALMLLFPSLREEARGRALVACDLTKRWDTSLPVEWSSWGALGSGERQDWIKQDVTWGPW